MANKANWFEKTFVMKDAQVKRESATKEAKDVSEDDYFFEGLGRFLTKSGGAGKTIVVFRYVDGTVSH